MRPGRLWFTADLRLYPCSKNNMPALHPYIEQRQPRAEQVYLCGNSGMIFDVYRQLVAGGQEPASMHAEVYF